MSVSVSAHNIFGIAISIADRKIYLIQKAKSIWQMAKYVEWTGVWASKQGAPKYRNKMPTTFKQLECEKEAKWKTVKNIYFVTVNEFVLVHEITKPNKYLQTHKHN